MSFLGAGKSRFDLEHVNISEIRGTLDRGSVFSLVKGGSRFGGTAGIDINKLKVDEKGETTIDSIGAGGFVFDDAAMGVHLDIRSANLPKGMKIPATGPIEVPKLLINDAWFKVDHVSSLMKKGSGGPLVRSEIDYLNMLDGSISFTLDVNARYDRPYVPTIPIHLPLPVRLSVDHGVVDLDATVREINRGLALNDALHVVRNGSVMTLQVDLGKLLDSDQWAWLPNVDAKEWDLDPADVAQKGNRTTAPTLATPRPSTGGSNLKIDSLDMIDLNADVNMLGSYDFKVPPKGVVTIGGGGKDAMTHLKAATNASVKNQIDLTLAEANASVKDLEVTPTVGLGIGALQIKNMHDTKLNFYATPAETAATPSNAVRLQFPSGRSAQPDALEGTIGEATAENITINIAKKDPKEETKK
jgi:hypothetical protein